MIKKILVLAIALQFTGCTELQKVATQVIESSGGVQALSQTQIGNGLKEALNNGISNQVSNLLLQTVFTVTVWLKFYYLKN